MTRDEVQRCGWMGRVNQPGHSLRARVRAALGWPLDPKTVPTAGLGWATEQAPAHPAGTPHPDHSDGEPTPPTSLAAGAGDGPAAGANVSRETAPGDGWAQDRGHPPASASSGDPTPISPAVYVQGDAAATGRQSQGAAVEPVTTGPTADVLDDPLSSDVSRETSTGTTHQLPPDDTDTPLARLLAENARRRQALAGVRLPKPAHPRILTVANQKGGVGKTTTTVNLAAALAHGGLSVLVIDLDPQGNASTALGIDHHVDVASIYDVLVDGTRIDEVTQPCPDVSGLRCAPSTIDLAGAEIELVSMVAREGRLKRAIESLNRTYDYIFIDCPPSLGLLTVNAFVAAAEVLIPIQCEYYALEGLSQLLRNIEMVRSHLNPELHVSTILLTMYDARTRLSAQVADEVRSHFPDKVLSATVPRSVRVSEAPGFGQTVVTYDPGSSGALSYREAAGEIARRGATTDHKE